MRFAILRRFSHLMHRRTSSEPGVLPSHPIAPLDALTRSASLGNMAISTSSFFDTILPPNETPLPPTLYSPDIRSGSSSPLTPSPAFSMPARPDSSQIPESLQLVAMRKQLEEMRVAYDNLKLDFDLREAEAKESDTGALERFSSLVPEEQHTFVIHLHRKVVRFEKYFNMMHEVGVPTQLLAGTHNAISSGRDFEDELVHSIRNAALNPSSPWSSIVPAVIGPRAPDQYRAAISNILRTRQEVVSAKKTAKFWKQTARALGAGLDIITPSPSNVSDIQIALSPERAQVANELLSKLRSGEIPLRSQVVSHGTLPHGDSTLSVSISRSGSSHSIVIGPVGGSELPYVQSSHSALAPLASQAFREEFMASCSGSGRRFSVSTASSGRSSYARDSLELVRSHKGKGRQVSAEMSSQLISDLSQQSELGRKISSIIAPASRSLLDKLSQSWKPLEDGVFDDTPDSVSGLSKTDSATRLRENFEKRSELASSDGESYTGEDGVMSSSDDADMTMVDSDSRMQKSGPSPAKKSMLPVLMKPANDVSTASFPIPPNSPMTPPFAARPTISSTMKHASSTPVKNMRVDIRPLVSPTAPLRVRKKSSSRLGEKQSKENKENVPPSMLVKGRTRLRRWSRLAT